MPREEEPKPEEPKEEEPKPKPKAGDYVEIYRGLKIDKVPIAE